MNAPKSGNANIAATLARLFGVMPASRRRQFYRLIALMSVGAFAEIVTIGSVLPLLGLLADPERGQDIPLLQAVFRVLGIGSRSDMLLVAGAAFTAAAVAASVIRLRLLSSIQTFVFGLGHDITVEIQRRILTQPYSYHLRRNSSEILASLNKTDALVFDVLLQGMNCASALLLSIFIIGALIAVDALTALIAIAFVGCLYTVLMFVFHRRLHKNSEVIERSLEERIRIVQESLGGIRDIIIDDSKAEFVAAFANVNRRLSQAHASTILIGAAPRYIIEGASLALVAGLALLTFAREGGIGGALPILGALALGAQRLLPLVQQIYNGWAYMAGNWHVGLEVLNLLSLPVSNEAEGADRPLSLQRELQLQDVTYAYPGRRAPALEEIELVIPRGSLVALVGKTGSGKSTLADLVMGLLEPTAGQIFVDGVALDKRALRRWQRSIAHVPQTIFLADASIARNIAFGTPEHAIDRERVHRAAVHAQLEGLIASLPDGYETLVGERGISLSGGQRQRLALARAFYKDAVLVVLDEATSALDDETEAAVASALVQMVSEGRTILVIAHRSNLIALSDMVVRLDAGRIMEVSEPQRNSSRNAEKSCWPNTR